MSTFSMTSFDSLAKRLAAGLDAVNNESVDLSDCARCKGVESLLSLIDVARRRTSLSMSKGLALYIRELREVPIETYLANSGATHFRGCCLYSD